MGRGPGGGDRAGGELVTRGLYSLVRHPMYLASLLVIWLSPGMSLNTLVLFVLMSLYFFVGSVHEERLLVAQFGEEYEAYRARVPRIIPWLKLPGPRRVP